MEKFTYILTFVIAYIVGSISFGAIMARVRGVDIFNTGSGSPGATNVNRSMGKKAGRLVFVCDFLKGVIPSWFVMSLFQEQIGLYSAMLALLGALLGHNFSIFHGFRGGKGVATTIGGLAVIMPRSLIFGLLVWLVIFHATRIVSLASLAFVSSTILTAHLFGYPKACQFFTIILSAIIFFGHRKNISRLIAGTEYKFSKKSSG